jgi:hypothetical protein
MCPILHNLSAHFHCRSVVYHLWRSAWLVLADSCDWLVLVINWQCIWEWCQNFSPARCIGAGTSWSTTPKVHWKCWVWYYLHKGTSFSRFSTPSMVLFMFHHVIMWCLSMVLGHCYQQENLLCNKPLPQDCLWIYPLAFYWAFALQKCFFTVSNCFVVHNLQCSLFGGSVATGSQECQFPGHPALLEQRMIPATTNAWKRRLPASSLPWLENKEVIYTRNLREFLLRESLGIFWSSVCEGPLNKNPVTIALDSQFQNLQSTMMAISSQELAM